MDQARLDDRTSAVYNTLVRLLGPNVSRKMGEAGVRTAAEQLVAAGYLNQQALAAATRKDLMKAGLLSGVAELLISRAKGESHLQQPVCAHPTVWPPICKCRAEAQILHPAWDPSSCMARPCVPPCAPLGSLCTMSCGCTCPVGMGVLSVQPTAALSVAHIMMHAALQHMHGVPSIQNEQWVRVLCSCSALSPAN
jgi:hypothetical protein